jgi:gamma-glutamyltranspeptidase/glutathione hydrolase
MKASFRSFLACLALSWAGIASATPSVATGTGGAVASISDEATAAGIRVLNEGGNAAVATAATLGITEPFSCGIGGGGFMLIYLANERRVTTIDHRETAPAAFTSEIFREHDAELPFDEAVRSALSVGRARSAAGSSR